MSTLAERKRAVRRAATARRAALADKLDLAAAAEAVAARAAPLAAIGPVAAFWPLPDELDTGPLLRALLARRFDVCLPVVAARDAPLIFRRWTPETVLVERQFRVMTPPEDAEPLAPRTLFVPLLAFDRRRYRLGYGGGFYDRTITALAPDFAVGLAFADQEADNLPTEPHDRRLDAVVTERAVLTG